MYFLFLVRSDFIFFWSNTVYYVIFSNILSCLLIISGLMALLGNIEAKVLTRLIVVYVPIEDYQLFEMQ